ncbi:MAG: hypothetical protein COB69_08455 [Phycisphaera sp.]|nr:MAG: hypothetical protein COB69_08455 [Phycisphaera sp.]
MDERFQTYANRAATYKVRLQQHRDKPRGPLENAINIFLSLLIFIVLLVLIIPLIALIILLAIAFLIYFKIKSFFRGLGKPNARVGPVRTDGRDNVRVIDRD